MKVVLRTLKSVSQTALTTAFPKCSPNCKRSKPLLCHKDQSDQTLLSLLHIRGDHAKMLDLRVEYLALWRLWRWSCSLTVNKMFGRSLMLSLLSVTLKESQLQLMGIANFILSVLIVISLTLNFVMLLFYSSKNILMNILISSPKMSP